MRRIKKILFPTDYSRISTRGAKQAVALARTLGAELYLLHVVGLDTYIRLYGGSMPSFSDDLDAAVQKSAEKQIRRLMENLKAGRVKIRGKILLGAPGETICRYASKTGIDLIVIPTHGRKGASRFFLGSVAERVVRLAPCPVLTLRGPALRKGA